MKIDSNLTKFSDYEPFNNTNNNEEDLFDLDLQITEEKASNSVENLAIGLTRSNEVTCSNHCQSITCKVRGCP